MTTNLHLHEEILLLALRDEKGTPHASLYGLAMGGAILSELLLLGRISVEDNKKKMVNVESDKPLGEPLIDECLWRIASAKRRANPQAWVTRFAHTKDLHHRVARGLCDKDILRAEEDTILFIFRRKVYPEFNPKPERALIERMRKAIFKSSGKVDPRTAILISLARSTGLLDIPFRKKDLKDKKHRLDQICEGRLMCKATAEAVQAAQAAQTAAIVTACIIPAVTTTIITN